MTGHRAIGGTTFSNTIVGMGATEESVGSLPNGQDQTDGNFAKRADLDDRKDTKLNSIMNTGTQGSVENLPLQTDLNAIAQQ